MKWLLVTSEPKWCMSPICHSVRLSIYLWLYSPLLDLGRLFSRFIFTQSVGPPARGSARRKTPTRKHRTTQTQNIHTWTSMLQVGVKR
jgi:hypothetical protein